MEEVGVRVQGSMKFDSFQEDLICYNEISCIHNYININVITYCIFRNGSVELMVLFTCFVKVNSDCRRVGDSI